MRIVQDLIVAALAIMGKEQNGTVPSSRPTIDTWEGNGTAGFNGTHQHNFTAPLPCHNLTIPGNFSLPGTNFTIPGHNITIPCYNGTIPPHNFTSAAPGAESSRRIPTFHAADVTVSLTTSPKRLEHLSEVLNRLNLNHCSQVVLTIPRGYGRDKLKYNATLIAELEARHPKLRVNVIEQDLGPITKILPTLQRISETNPKKGIVVSIDDDQGYNEFTIRELVEALLQAGPQVAAVGASGQRISFWKIEGGPFWSGTRPTDTDIVEGFAGIAYRATALDGLFDKLKEIALADSSCMMSDDLVLSWGLRLLGNRCMLLQSPNYGLHTLENLPYGFGEDAAHRGHGLEESMKAGEGQDINALKYQQCFEILNKQGGGDEPKRPKNNLRGRREHD
jgi:hypothetical protein